MIGLIAALAIQLWVLYQPGSPYPSVMPFPFADKVVHAAVFFLPAVFLRGLTSRWWPMVLLAVHAPVSELIQITWVPHRSGEIWDAIADLAGLALGVVLGSWRRRNVATSARSGLVQPC